MAEEFSFESIFEDSAPETGSETSAADEQTEQTDFANEENPAGSGDETAAEQESTPKQESFKVVYNGEEHELSLEQMTELAQKGMNYDKVHGQRETLQQEAKQLNAYKEFVEGVAKRNGMNADEYMGKAREWMRQQAVQQQMKQGLPQEVAEELVRLREESRLHAEQAAANQKQNEEAQKKEAQALQFRQFVDEYPDVKELPDEVIAAMQNGVELLSAYRAYENKQLKAQLAGLTKQQENAAKSVGSAASSGTADDYDAFLSGFFS